MNTFDYGRLLLGQDNLTAPVTVRTAKAPRQYLDANAWQIERIKQGMADAREGRTRPAEQVFAQIAAKHGWDH